MKYNARRRHDAEVHKERIKKLTETAQIWYRGSVWYDEEKGYVKGHGRSGTKTYAKKQSTRRMRHLPLEETYNNSSYKKTYDFWYYVY